VSISSSVSCRRSGAGRHRQAPATSTNVTIYQLLFNTNSAQGGSGGPVYEYRDSNQPWCTGDCVPAINVGEYAPPTDNSGTRITQDVFNNLMSWASG